MNYLQDVSKGNVLFMLEMIQIFINRTPETIQLLEDAVLVSDWEKVGFWAHKLKSTFAYMGMEELRLQLLDIEKCAKSGLNLETIPANFFQLKEKSAIVLKEIIIYHEQIKV